MQDMPRLTLFSSSETHPNITRAASSSQPAIHGTSRNSLPASELTTNLSYTADDQSFQHSHQLRLYAPATAEPRLRLSSSSSGGNLWLPSSSASAGHLNVGDVLSQDANQAPSSSWGHQRGFVSSSVEPAMHSGAHIGFGSNRTAIRDRRQAGESRQPQLSLTYEAPASSIHGMVGPGAAHLASNHVKLDIGRSDINLMPSSMPATSSIAAPPIFGLQLGNSVDLDADVSRSHRKRSRDECQQLGEARLQSSLPGMLTNRRAAVDFQNNMNRARPDAAKSSGSNKVSGDRHVPLSEILFHAQEQAQQRSHSLSDLQISDMDDERVDVMQGARVLDMGPNSLHHTGLFSVAQHEQHTQQQCTGLSTHEKLWQQLQQRQHERMQALQLHSQREMSLLQPNSSEAELSGLQLSLLPSHAVGLLVGRHGADGDLEVLRAAQAKLDGQVRLQASPPATVFHAGRAAPPDGLLFDVKMGAAAEQNGPLAAHLQQQALLLSPKPATCHHPSCNNSVLPGDGKMYCTQHMIKADQTGNGSTSPLCQAPGCIRVAVPSTDGQRIMCATHLKKANLKPRCPHCIFNSCGKIASCAKDGTRKYCVQHMRQLGLEPKGRICLVDDCNKMALPDSSGGRQFCMTHARQKNLQVKVPMCRREGCGKLAIRQLDGKKILCMAHMKELGGVPKMPVCREEGCTKIAIYAMDGSRVYCLSHMKAHGIEHKLPVCQNLECCKIAVYNTLGSRKYCMLHTKLHGLEPRIYTPRVASNQASRSPNDSQAGPGDSVRIAA